MKNSKVPEIRFKGFSGDWKRKKLGELTFKVSEKNKNNDFNETFTNSAEHGIINQREFFDKDISNAKSLNGYYVVRPNDFVYNPRVSNFAPVGPIKRNLLGRTGVMSPLYYVFRVTEGDNTFIEKYFQTIYWHEFMKLNGDNGARSDRFNIRDSVFEKMPIPFPSIEEQTQIGSFLKQLDDLINLNKKALEKLKQTKKAFLQKMFPKEDEKVPEIRFKGFSGDWEKQNLGEIADIVGGGTPSTNIEEYWNGDIDWYAPSEIGNQIFLVGSQRKITEIGLRKSSTKMLPVGTVLFTSRAGIGNTGILKKTGVTNQGFQSIVPHENKLNSYFIFSRTNELKKYAEIVASGSTFLEVSKKQMARMPILIPQLSEQIQIGNFFKQLDDLIKLNEKALEKLKETKKAFLQKMFV